MEIVATEMAPALVPLCFFCIVRLLALFVLPLFLYSSILSLNACIHHNIQHNTNNNTLTATNTTNTQQQHSNSQGKSKIDLTGITTSSMNSTSAAPLSDAKVFKEYPARHSALPQRNIFNVDIVDSQSGALQVLDSLQRSGPLHFKGWVPIEETKHASGKHSKILAQHPPFLLSVSVTYPRDRLAVFARSPHSLSLALLFDAIAKDSGKFIYIFGEIIEWTHQYDPARPKRPIFWLKSYGVGWYKIEASSRVAIRPVSSIRQSRSCGWLLLLLTYYCSESCICVVVCYNKL